MGESHLKFFVRLPVHRGLNKQRENIKQTTLSAFVIAPHAQQIEDPQMCNMNFVWVSSWNHPSASILPYFEANKIVWMFKIELCIKVAQKMCKRSGQFATKSANLGSDKKKGQLGENRQFCINTKKGQLGTNSGKETILHQYYKRDNLASWTQTHNWQWRMDYFTPSKQGGIS